MTPEECFKEATRLKKEGRFDEALAKLREGYALVPGTGMEYSIEVYLRLPAFLQLAGREEEAWEEFHRILSEGPFSKHGPGLVEIERSTVFDKMRLFLQRIGKPDMAVAYGLCKEFSWANGRRLQAEEEEALAAKRVAEVAEYATKEDVESFRKHVFDIAKSCRKEVKNFQRNFDVPVRELLDKAKRPECEDDICELIRPMALDLGSFDPNAVISGVCGILGLFKDG